MCLPGTCVLLANAVFTGTLLPSPLLLRPVNMVNGPNVLVLAYSIGLVLVLHSVLARLGPVRASWSSSCLQIRNVPASSLDILYELKMHL